MRLDKSGHTNREWRVQSLAPDFSLLDVWQYPIVADSARGEDFAMFRDVMSVQETPDVGGAASFLFRLRTWLGNVFGWDEETNTLPIPGCEERSLRSRLSDNERATQQYQVDHAMFREVYTLSDEALFELSNSTVHAMLHVGWVHLEGTQFAPQLAVYAKPRGWFGRAYMRLISPFRHHVVYPALMRAARAKWERARAATR